MAYGPPQSVYTTQTPVSTLSGLGTEGSDVTFAKAGRLTGMRYYRAPGDSAAHFRTLVIWSSSGVELKRVVTSGETTEGWKTWAFASPLDVTAGQKVRATYTQPGSSSRSVAPIPAANIVNGDLTMSKEAWTAGGTTPIYPTTVSGSTWFVDVIFEAVATLAITATPYPTRAQIRLTITDAADGVVTIVRSDRNGTAEVRQPAGAVSAAGLLIVDDYEAAVGGDVTYTATDWMGNSASVTLTDPLGPGAGDGGGMPWLSHPNLPALNTQVVIIEDLPTWAHRSTQHLIYGKAAPIYTTQPMQTRTGRLSLLCSSWDEVRAIHGLYERGNAVLLRNPCLTEADYYHVGDITPAPTVASNWQGNWRVDIDYTEVDSPSGPMQGTVDWTWDDVVATEDSWDTTRANWHAWADLVAGPAPA